MPVRGGHGGGGGGMGPARHGVPSLRNPGVDNALWQMIVHFSGPLRLDPYAVAAVSRVEGGGRFGEVGDGGTSYGPFQLHVGGALPAGRDAAWANSPQGVLYALQQMAHSGAAGLIGRSAVAAIVTRFERPAAPAAEVANAWAGYKSYGGAPPGGGGGGVPQPPQNVTLQQQGVPWQNLMKAQLRGQAQLAQMLQASQLKAQQQFVQQLQSQAAQQRQQALSDQLNAKIGAARTAQQSLSAGGLGTGVSDPAALLTEQRKTKLADIHQLALRRAGIL